MSPLTTTIGTAGADPLAQAAGQVQAVAVGQVDVDDDARERAAVLGRIEPPQGRGHAFEAGGRVALSGQRADQRAAGAGVILNDEDAAGIGVGTRG